MKLIDLVAGDKVVHDGHCRTIVVITRTTETQIIIKGSNTRYNRITGRKVGKHSIWDMQSIRYATDDELKELSDSIYKSNLIYKISTFNNWYILPIKDITNVYELIKDLE